jgi:type VI secretion system FHA domain protein
MFMIRLLRHDDPTGRVLDERPFDGGALVVGRGTSADWVIQDPQRLLSKRHCEIRRVGASAMVVDTSSNGVFLNGSSARLTAGEATPVRLGDQIRLGDYILRFDAMVENRGFEPRPEPPENPFRSPLTMPGLPSPRSLPQRGRFQTGEDDPLKATDKPISALSGLRWDEPARATAEPERPRGIAVAFELPMRAPDQLDSAHWSIPENWDDWQGAQEPLAATPLPAPEPETQVAAEWPLPQREDPVPQIAANNAAASPAANSAALPADGLAAFLRGAQLKPGDFADADAERVLEAAGQAYRAAVLGVSEVLRDRAFVKNQFRIAQTMMVTRNANPLRMFEPGEAAVLLLKAQISGFLSAGPAFTTAFQDVKKHQLATLAGLRAAVRAAVSALDPTPAEGAKVGGWFGRSAATALARLQDSYARFQAEADDNPDSIINREFRRGYEACLDQIARAETGEGS